MVNVICGDMDQWGVWITKINLLYTNEHYDAIMSFNSKLCTV
jgi:hypothetical protein